jgi:hypothetical protein
MASFESAESISLLAGSDFTGDLYKVAEISAANTADVANATTDVVAGIIGEEVTSGKVFPLVLLKGRVKVRAGAAITVGQLIVPAADGEVTGVADLTAIPVDSMAIGIALTAAAAAGDIFEMLAMPIAAPHTA